MEPSTAARDRLTEVEARARAEQIGDISYALDLDLERGAKVFRADLVVTFDHSGGDAFMEWVGGTIDRFEINGAVHDPGWDGTRIALPARLLQEHNEIRISYERRYDKTGEGFHQFIDPEDGSEYIYTQFEPYSAHRLFPCFDQPDLKAVYRVSVTAPSDWAVVTAGAEMDREELPDGRSRRVFAETVPFSTYLLSVCAGPFASVHDEHEGIPLGLYVRSGWIEHLDADAIFSVTKAGMDFYSDLFDEPYPFGKFDQLFVPEFNWGGMENVAAVTYTDSGHLHRHGDLPGPSDGGSVDPASRVPAPRTRPHVVRRSGHHAVVERSVAKRVVRLICRLSGTGRQRWIPGHLAGLQLPHEAVGLPGGSTPHYAQDRR